MRVDGDLRQRLAETICHRCKREGAIAIVGFDWPHFGRVICAHCAGIDRDRVGYLDWLQAPKEPIAERRRRKAIRVTDLGDRCEICLRSAEQLTEPCKLESHHALEHEVTQDDANDNLRVYCTDCHSLVHWARRSLGREHAE